jgi:hypothetical protein
MFHNKNEPPPFRPHFPVRFSVGHYPHGSARGFMKNEHGKKVARTAEKLEHYEEFV